MYDILMTVCLIGVIVLLCLFGDTTHDENKSMVMD
jgi:hypothetical protein